MYKIIRESEINLAFNIKKEEISEKYKKILIKLFCTIDEDNYNVLDLDEFKSFILKIKICNENKIKNMFIKADLNNDGYLSIDEFIEFLFIIMSYWKK